VVDVQHHGRVFTGFGLAQDGYFSGVSANVGRIDRTCALRLLARKAGCVR